MRTFQYRLYPTKEQQAKLWQHTNKLNSLYNYFLNQKIEAYKKDKTNIGQLEQQKELIVLKSNDSIMADIHSQVVQQVPLRLNKSYQAFFRRVKNKKKLLDFQSFVVVKIFSAFAIHNLAIQ